MYPLFIKSASHEPVTTGARAHSHASEWLVRNRYGFPIIGLAFYYTGFVLVGFIFEEELLRAVLMSIPLLAGLAVRKWYIIILGVVLTLFESIYGNIPFGLLDHFGGLGWGLAGMYISFSSILLILTLIAWFMSSQHVS